MRPISETINKIFPIPAFLRMPFTGLDISERRIRFLKFREKRGIHTIQYFGEEKIPEGVIKSGTIKDVSAIQNILKKIKEKYAVDFVKLSLPEERGYITQMEVPAVEGEELRNSILFQLEDYIPLSSKKAVFDYATIDDTDKEKKRKEVVVSAFPRDEIQSYLDIFSGTGITPVAFEVEAQAIARSVIKKNDKGTYMVVDFGRNRSGIFIVSRGIVRFTSTIEVGSEIITNVLKRTLSTNDQEAEKIKNEQGLNSKNKDDEIYSSILSSVSILRDEVNKIFIYWHTHRRINDESEKIEKIILCGGGANLKGLTDYLSTSLKAPVAVANPWTNIASFDEYIPKISSSQSLGYTTTIGLAMPE